MKRLSDSRMFPMTLILAVAVVDPVDPAKVMAEAKKYGVTVR